VTGTLTFSDDQDRAVERILDWRERCPQYQSSQMTLGGYAGTGKTSIVSHLCGQWSCVATCAFCGKAAHVLRSKGVEATTIHSLIYVPFENEEGKIRFTKRRYLDGVSTILVDEASMIDHIVYADLMSFNVPVLFVGDHGQLEPIGTNPNLMKEPELRLETIHRQAAENPIIRLAHAFREGRSVPKWSDPKGRLSVLSRRDFERRISPDVQIICGFNKTRHGVNKRVRDMLGYRQLVEDGERLVVLRNNKDWQIFNGQQVTVEGVVKDKRSTMELAVLTDDGRQFVLPIHKPQLGHPLIEDFRNTDIALCDYGYTLTAHKAQGSEYSDVLVYEELSSFWDARRWRYTAATRASERLTYCA
jgi:exodeoxyribonuclease-5